MGSLVNQSSVIKIEPYVQGAKNVIASPITRRSNVICFTHVTELSATWSQVLLKQMAPSTGEIKRLNNLNLLHLLYHG